MTFLIQVAIVNRLYVIYVMKDLHISDLIRYKDSGWENNQRWAGLQKSQEIEDQRLPTTGWHDAE